MYNRQIQHPLLDSWTCGKEREQISSQTNADVTTTDGGETVSNTPTVDDSTHSSNS